MLTRLNLGESRGELLLALLGLLGEALEFVAALLEVLGGALLGRDSLTLLGRVLGLGSGAAVPEHSVQAALPRAAKRVVSGSQDVHRLLPGVVVAALRHAQLEHLALVRHPRVSDGGGVEVEHRVRIRARREDASNLLLRVQEEGAFLRGRLRGLGLGGGGGGRGGGGSLLRSRGLLPLLPFLPPGFRRLRRLRLGPRIRLRRIRRPLRLLSLSLLLLLLPLLLVRGVFLVCGGAVIDRDIPAVRRLPIRLPLRVPLPPSVHHLRLGFTRDVRGGTRRRLRHVHHLPRRALNRLFRLHPGDRLGLLGRAVRDDLHAFLVQGRRRLGLVFRRAQQRGFLALDGVLGLLVRGEVSGFQPVHDERDDVPARGEDERVVGEVVEAEGRQAGLWGVLREVVHQRAHEQEIDEPEPEPRLLAPVEGHAQDRAHEHLEASDGDPRGGRLALDALAVLLLAVHLGDDELGGGDHGDTDAHEAHAHDGVGVPQQASHRGSICAATPPLAGSLFFVTTKRGRGGSVGRSGTIPRPLGRVFRSGQRGRVDPTRFVCERRVRRSRLGSRRARD